MNLSQIGAQISQAQLNQIVNTFGADPAFQTFLSTGTLPTNPSTPSPTNIASPNSPGGTPIPGVAQAAAAAAAGIPLPAAPAYTGSTPAPAPTAASTTASTTPTTSAIPISVPGNPGNTPVTPATAPLPVATPVVAGSGLASTTFNSLASAPTASALLSQLSTMNLSQIGAQISQAQLNQIVNTFGADPSFQTFLSTGKIPPTLTAPNASSASSSNTIAPTPSVPTGTAASTGASSSSNAQGTTNSSGTSTTSVAPTPIVIPSVSGSGLDSTSFNNLANSTSATSLLSQLATQNLASIASQISQSQLNQLVNKFGSDPNFQTLISTGSIPVTALTGSKVSLSSVTTHQQTVPGPHIELQLTGLHLAS
jgi:hypothetical protein